MYSAEISRAQPSVILFLVDQSGSMAEPMAGDANRPKAQGVADAINKLLQTLVIKCSKDDGVRNYYEVGIIGYGGTVVSALAGDDSGKGLLPIAAVADNPLRVEQRTRQVEDGAGGLVSLSSKFPVWFDPSASGGTPMKEALQAASTILGDWVASHPNSFPPIVINITDGESTDGDPSPTAAQLCQLATADGTILLFNVHLSSFRAASIEFPDDSIPLPDQFASLLYSMSSVLPPHIADAAAADGYRITDTTRGFVFNGDLASVIKTLNIGTLPANMR